MIQRSSDRILTTHTGSLPRPPELIEVIRKREAGEAVDEGEFRAQVRDAVALTVRRQIEAGIDLVSDGEEGKQALLSSRSGCGCAIGGITENLTSMPRRLCA